MREWRKHGYDRWKFDCHRLRTQLEAQLRDPNHRLTLDRLDDITQDPELRDLTRRILATHKHSKVDSIAERWMWNRFAIRDRESKWEQIPDQMITDVLDDMLQTLVNAQAEHVGRLTDAMENPKKRLVSEGIESKTINDDQRELLLRSAQLGYQIKRGL